MSDKIEIEVGVTGTEASAAQIRKLEREIDQLALKIKNSFNPKTKVQNSIVDPAIQANLEKLGKTSTKVSETWVRSFTKMASIGKLTSDTYGKITSELEKHEGSFKKTGELTKSQAATMDRLYAKANAFTYVWNRNANEFEKNERKKASLEANLDEIRTKRRRKASDDWFKEQRQRATIRNGSESLEKSQWNDRMGRVAKRFRLQTASEAAEKKALSDRLTGEGRRATLMRNSEALEQSQIRRAEIDRKAARAKADKDFNAKLAGIRISNGIRSRTEAEEQKAIKKAEAAKKAAKDKADKEYSDKLSAIKQSSTIMRNSVAAEAAAEAKLRRERKAADAAELRRRREISREGRQAWGAARDAGQRIMSGARRTLGYGTAAAGALALGSKTAIGEARTVDTEQTYARIFQGGKTPLSKEFADDLLKNWAIPEGFKLGVKPSQMMGTANEAAQAGVPTELLKPVTTLLTKAAVSLRMAPRDLVESLGPMFAQLAGKGELTADKASKLINTTVMLANMTAATRGSMVSALRTGIGAGSVMGMDEAHTMAFMATLIEGGAQGQQAARALSSVNEQLPNLAMKEKKIRMSGNVADPENQVFLKGAQKLGYNNWADFNQRLKKDPNTAAMDLLQRFDRIKDPVERSQLFFEVMGKSFGRFELNAAKMKEGAANALKIALDGMNGFDYLTGVFQVWTEGMEFDFQRLSNAWESVLSSAGEGFKPYIRDFTEIVGQWAVDLSQNDNLGRIVSSAIDGFVEGLGYKNFRDMLKDIFGGLDQGTFQKIRDFAKGFAEGLKSVWNFVKTVFLSIASLFSGTSSAETIGKFAGKLLALSAALVALSPVISVLTTLVAVIWSIVRVAKALKDTVDFFLGKTPPPVKDATNAAKPGVGRLLPGVGSILGLQAAVDATDEALTPEQKAHVEAQQKASDEAKNKNFETFGWLRGSWENFKESFGLGGKVTVGPNPDQIPTTVPPSAGKSLWDTLKDLFSVSSAHADELPADKRGARFGPARTTAPDTPVGLIQRSAFRMEDTTEKLAKSFERMGAKLELAALQAGTNPMSGGGGGGSGGGGTSGTAPSVPLTGGSVAPGSVFPTAPELPDYSGLGSGGIIRRSPGAGTPADEGGGARTGGSRSWRNNNPGNIRFGARARQMGATGRDDRGFAVFPNYEAGRRAQENLMFNSDLYRGKTIAGAITKWAPPSENDTAGYIRRMTSALGVSPDTPLASLTPEQRSKFLDVQQAHEGWIPGRQAAPGEASLGGAGSQRGGNIIPGAPAGLARELGIENAQGHAGANFMHGQYGGIGQNLTTVATPGGRRVTVNAAAAESFKGFLGELEASGYHINSLGGYANRAIRGSTSRASQHAYGNAIDINPNQNPMGYGPLRTNLPANIADVAAKYGLSWGGHWKNRKDAMHFEWMGMQPWKNPAIAERLRQRHPLANAPAPTPSSVTSGVPAAPPAGGGGSGGGGGGSGDGSDSRASGQSAMIHAPITIHGAGKNPQEIAQEVQRHIQNAMMSRQHDVETGLA